MANVKTDKEHIKKELRKLFRSMDFVSKKFLADEKAAIRTFRRISTSISSSAWRGNFSDSSASTGTVIRIRGKNMKSAGYAAG